MSNYIEIIEFIRKEKEKQIKYLEEQQKKYSISPENHIKALYYILQQYQYAFNDVQNVLQRGGQVHPDYLATLNKLLKQNK